MKIKNLMLKNFAKVSEISVSFDENITYLIGTNGSGKTTVGLNGIWFIFKGLAQKGDGLIAERFRFIGPHSKSAQGMLTIQDETEGVEIKISRKLLKNKTELKIEASDGRQLGQDWLDSIFNSFLINPVGFSRLSGKDQALAFGANTASYDVKKKELELERRDVGRDVKRLQGVVDSVRRRCGAASPEKVESVDVKELMAELGERQKLNQVRKDALDKLEVLDRNIEESLGDVEYFEQKLSTAKNKLVGDNDARHDKANDIQGMKIADEQEIMDQIENAQGTNKKAVDYLTFLENQSALEDSQLDFQGKNREINGVESARTEYLKSLKLPWPNISITDDGEFRLNDKPFCAPYFSTGEILKFGARIGSKLKDGLKYVYFPCSNNLDEKNREVTFKVLVEDGFQVVAEFVGTEKKKDTSILLKEMKVVESYDETEGRKLH